MKIRLPFLNSFPAGKCGSQASGQLSTSSVDLHLSHPNTAQDTHFIAKMTGSDDLRQEEQVPRWRLQPKSHRCPPHILSNHCFQCPWKMAPASNACQCQSGLWVVPLAFLGGRVSAFWLVGPRYGGRADCKHGHVPGPVQPLALCAA